MKLRTFTAPDMPAAMEMVRKALGDDAIIISSKEVINGKRTISVTAASDAETQDDIILTQRAALMPTPRHEEADDLRYELQTILRFHNLPELFVAKILQKSSDQHLGAVLGLHRIGNRNEPRQLYRLALEKILSMVFDFAPLPLDTTPSRLMLVGMPGIGKTLTIAKMAARLSMDGQPVAVITTDNKRAGGIEQLQAFTSILGLELQVAASQEELKRLLKTLPSYSRVLIDTAGCNPYDAVEVKELAGYASLGVEPVLVMPAGGDSLEAVDMAEAFAPIPAKRLLVTQADSARRFGGVLAIAAAKQMSFCHISSSSSIADSITPADPALLAGMLLKYRLA